MSRKRRKGADSYFDYVCGTPHITLFDLSGSFRDGFTSAGDLLKAAGVGCSGTKAQTASDSREGVCEGSGKRVSLGTSLVEPIAAYEPYFNHSGERALWTFVLQSALGEAARFILRKKKQRHARRRGENAIEWIQSDELEYEAPGFLWVCSSLRVDALFIRRSVTAKDRSVLEFWASHEKNKYIYGGE